MKARCLYCLMSIVLASALLTGCRKVYPESLRYYLASYPKKETQNGVDVKGFEEFKATGLATNVATALEPIFGTPRFPLVKVPADVQNDLEMQLSKEQLERGGLLYRNLCLTCHGLVGDGTGPTGNFLDPKPRDFRQGYFKFRSTEKSVPSRDDLIKTLRHGVPGASMPAFGMLGDKDLNDIVSYVIHLSLRGKVERQLAKELDGGGSPEADKMAEEEAGIWMADAKQVVKPTDPTGGWEKFYQDGFNTQFKRGKEIFLSKEAACVECHGKDGRSSVVELPTNRMRKNEWGDPLFPRDLTSGVFRGGSRPIDLFYRVKTGLPGSGMPAAAIKDDEIWHLVYYVLSLPRGQ